MENPRAGPAATDTEEPDAPALTLRGIGVALTADSLRALLDPATRAAAELVVDLSRLSLELPAEAIAEVVAKAAPDLEVELAENGATVRRNGLPAIRCRTAPDGVRVRIGADGLTIGDPGNT